MHQFTSLATRTINRPDRLAPQNRVLAALPESELEDINGRLAPMPVGCETVLIEADAPITHVYFPLDCVVTLMVPADSQAIDVAVIGPDGIVGASVAAGATRSSCRAVVQTPGTVLALRADVFSSLMSGNSTLAGLVERWQNALTEQVQQIAVCNAVHSVEQRLARWLLQIRDHADGDVVPVTQEMLAHMLGVQRTTVTLVVQHFKMRGIVRQRRGRLDILDRNALEAAACGCYHRIKASQTAPARV